MMVLKTQTGVSYRAQCRSCALAYSSLMRWKGHLARGEPVLRRPGPAKGQRLDLAQLEKEIQALRHRRKRSGGAGALWERYHDQISRRQLQRLIAEVRNREKRKERDGLQLITWRRAGLVWSMDDVELDRDAGGGKTHVHAVQDLGSRYKFPPLTGEQLADGATVAVHLESLFHRFGPPLFLKRDNHGNLNGQEVDGVMERFRVLPLNSPSYYAPYNGGMERAQREIQEELGARLAAVPGVPVGPLLEAAVQLLNHQPRPCLDGKTSCVVFSLGMAEARRYTRRKRREVLDWIKSLAARILAQGDGARELSAAQSWRIAAQTWLQCHGVISIAKEKKCYPVS